MFTSKLCRKRKKHSTLFSRSPNSHVILTRKIVCYQTLTVSRAQEWAARVIVLCFYACHLQPRGNICCTAHRVPHPAQRLAQHPRTSTDTAHTVSPLYLAYSRRSSFAFATVNENVERVYKFLLFSPLAFLFLEFICFFETRSKAKLLCFTLYLVIIIFIDANEGGDEILTVSSPSRLSWEASCLNGTRPALTIL